MKTTKLLAGLLLLWLPFMTNSCKEPQEENKLSFEIVDQSGTLLSGTQTFIFSQTKTFTVNAANVAKTSIDTPAGWSATVNISSKTFTIVAPAASNKTAATTGNIKVTASPLSGEAITVTVPVEISMLSPAIEFASMPEPFEFAQKITLPTSVASNIKTIAVSTPLTGWTLTANVSATPVSIDITAPAAGSNYVGAGTILATATSESGEAMDFSIPVSLKGISTVEQFTAFCAEVGKENGDLSAYTNGGEIILHADIDLSAQTTALFATGTPGSEEAAPIAFNSVFNGNNHSIKLNVNSTDAPTIGLFEVVGPTAVFKNLKLEGKITSEYFGAKIGVLAVTSLGATFENITSDVELAHNATGSTSDGYFGGITAEERGSGTYTNCHVKGALAERGARYFGGLIGTIWDKTSGTMTDCSNSGAMTFNFGSAINMGSGQYGGIVGSTIDSSWKFTRVSNTGNINFNVGESGGAIRALGGICGTAYGEFVECFNLGNITDTDGTKALTGTRRIGGFAGACWGDQNVLTATKCYNSGNITCMSNFVGGFIGIVENGNASVYCQFIDCTNNGNVTILSAVSLSDAFGGFAGTIYNVALFKGCKNTGKVLGFTKRCAGGLIGRAADNVYLQNCENSGNVFVGATANLAKAFSPVVGGLCGIAGDGSTINISNSKNTGAITAMVQWAEAVGSVYGCEGITRNIVEPDKGYGDLNVCDQATRTASEAAKITAILPANWTASVPDEWLK